MASQHGALKVALGVADTAGGVLAVENDSGEDRIITGMVVNVTTKSTSAATVDIGVAADGTTSNDTLMDGLDVGTAAICADLVINAGTNGKNARLWAAGEFITASKASGACAGLVGNAYIEYIVV